MFGHKIIICAKEMPAKKSGSKFKQGKKTKKRVAFKGKTCVQMPLYLYIRA